MATHIELVAPAASTATPPFMISLRHSQQRCYGDVRKGGRSAVHGDPEQSCAAQRPARRPHYSRRSVHTLIALAQTGREERRHVLMHAAGPLGVALWKLLAVPVDADVRLRQGIVSLLLKLHVHARCPSPSTLSRRSLPVAMQLAFRKAAVVARAAAGCISRPCLPFAPLGLCSLCSG